MEGDIRGVNQMTIMLHKPYFSIIIKLSINGKGLKNNLKHSTWFMDALLMSCNVMQVKHVDIA